MGNSVFLATARFAVRLQADQANRDPGINKSVNNTMMSSMKKFSMEKKIQEKEIQDGGIAFKEAHCGMAAYMQTVVQVLGSRAVGP
jgi:hypothetical protein